MTFKTKKIRSKPRRKPFKKAKEVSGSIGNQIKRLPSKTGNYIAAFILVLFGLFIVTRVMVFAYNVVNDFSPKNLLFAMGSDLDKDEHGYTNILLLGDGGSERDGADLIDTIMVASIDYNKNAVSLLSVPRDFYVDKNPLLNVTRSGKINELYRNHKNALPSQEDRYQLFKAVAGSIVDLDIQYYMRVDFNAFVEIVDSLGGVMVDVDKAINDPYYPNENDNGYITFKIDEGLQEFDGETALKYVRSRKTTSDFDRAARQQKLLEALQQKALSRDVLTSPSTLKDIYSAVQDNINTDLEIREMIALGGFAKQMDRSHMVRKVIHDDPGQEGGFLYTPERKLYNGQFVLVPFGNDYDLIHRYADLIFHQREIYYEMPVIEVLNATRIPGIARNAAYQLVRFGFDVQSIDNYFDLSGNKKYLEQSVIEYYDYAQDSNGLITPKYQATINALDAYVKGDDVPSEKAYLLSEEVGKKVYEGGKANLSIVLGDDYDVFLVK